MTIEAEILDIYFEMIPNYFKATTNNFKNIIIKNKSWKSLRKLTPDLDKLNKFVENKIPIYTIN